MTLACPCNKSVIEQGSLNAYENPETQVSWTFKRLHIGIIAVEILNHVLEFHTQKNLVFTHQIVDTFILFCVADVLKSVSV